VTNHAGTPTPAQSTTIADLAADADIVRQLLDLRRPSVSLPEQARVVVSDSVIPDRALAVVADLDAYGD
jgi:hypothetical protein